MFGKNNNKSCEDLFVIYFELIFRAGNYKNVNYVDVSLFAVPSNIKAHTDISPRLTRNPTRMVVGIFNQSIYININYSNNIWNGFESLEIDGMTFYWGLEKRPAIVLVEHFTYCLPICHETHNNTTTIHVTLNSMARKMLNCVGPIKWMGEINVLWFNVINCIQFHFLDIFKWI